jgi:hypothetical protein
MSFRISHPGGTIYARGQDKKKQVVIYRTSYEHPRRAFRQAPVTQGIFKIFTKGLFILEHVTRIFIKLAGHGCTNPRSTQPEPEDRCAFWKYISYRFPK